MADHILQLLLRNLDQGSLMKMLNDGIFRWIHDSQRTAVFHAANHGGTPLRYLHGNRSGRHLSDQLRNHPAGKNRFPFLFNIGRVRIFNHHGAIGAGHRDAAIPGGKENSFQNLFRRTGGKRSCYRRQPFQQILRIHRKLHWTTFFRRNREDGFLLII